MWESSATNGILDWSLSKVLALFWICCERTRYLAWGPLKASHASFEQISCSFGCQRCFDRQPSSTCSSRRPLPQFRNTLQLSSGVSCDVALRRSCSPVHPSRRLRQTDREGVSPGIEVNALELASSSMKGWTASKGPRGHARTPTPGRPPRRERPRASSNSKSSVRSSRSFGRIAIAASQTTLSTLADITPP